MRTLALIQHQHHHNLRRLRFLQFSTFRHRPKCSLALTWQPDDKKKEQPPPRLLGSTKLSSSLYPAIAIPHHPPIRYLSTSEFTTKATDHDGSTTDPELTRRERFEKLGRRGAKFGRKGAVHFRDLVRKYGIYFSGTYITIYAATLTSFFIGIDSGLIDPTYIPFLGHSSSSSEEKENLAKMIAELLEHWEWTANYAGAVEKSPKLTNLGVAWLATKVTEPVRLGVALWLTPRVARFFGKEIVEENVEDETKKGEMEK